MIRSLFFRNKNNTRRARRQPLSSSLSSTFSFLHHFTNGSENVCSNDEIDKVICNNPTPISLISPPRIKAFVESQQYVLPSPWMSTERRQKQNFYRHGCRYLSTYNANTAFVSRHNHSINVTAEEILNYCAKSNGIAFTEGARTTNTHVVIRECPFCTKPTRNKPSNLHKLHIQIGGGAFFCHRCGTGGSWYDLKAHFGGFNVERGMNNSNTFGSRKNNNFRSLDRNDGWSYGNSRNQQQRNNDIYNNESGTETCLPMPPTRLSGLYSSRLLDEVKVACENESKQNTDNKGVISKNAPLQYLTEVRGLNTKTLRKYGVGRAAYRFPSDKKGGGYQEAECITFPWIMRESDIKMQETMRGATFEMNGEDKNLSSSPTKSVTSTTNGTSEKNNAALASENEIEDAEMSGNNDAPSGPFLTRRIKARALERKSWQRLDPPGGGWGLFGLHTIPNDCTVLVLTEGEYDAMAVHQATGLPAVSLPNGCRSLPLQVLPLLERFEKIVLWMDSDEPGREGAEKFAKKLGVNRTYIVQCLEAKDANDALLRGDIDMKACIDNATLLPHDRIITFGDLRNDVLKELLEPELYSGTAIPSLPRFTQLIKGFRKGEMTVLTGPTGSGKTTFLGQVSLDLAEQGENVLWGSFEIKNTRLLHKLMRQFSRDSLPDSTEKNAREKFEALADRFENLSLYFMKFHGGSDVDEVLDAMEYAVYVNDVEHVILDNMQFMITRHSQKTAWDKFEVQDIAIEKFRKFATEHNVHVTLVVHPRKEDESSKLSISSFFGSAKATQEADTVIIIQNDANRRKYLDVKKNRFDGTLGYSPIYFQSKSGRYVEDEGSAGSQTVLQGNHYQNNNRPKRNASPPEPKDLDSHWERHLSPPAARA